MSDQKDGPESQAAPGEAGHENAGSDTSSLDGQEDNQSSQTTDTLDAFISDGIDDLSMTPVETVSVEETIASLITQIAELEDLRKRDHAEMQNLRKRTEREKQDMAKFAIQKFAESALPAADNMSRALETAKRDGQDPKIALEALIEGVGLTERALLTAFEGNGITRFEPKGEIFDANCQVAFAMLEDASVAPNTVLEVFEAGYMISGRVLRSARVVISKAPASAADPVTGEGQHETPGQPQPIGSVANDDTPIDPGTTPSDAPDRAPSEAGSDDASSDTL